MSEGEQERRSLASMMDFWAFVAMLLLYGSMLLLLASISRGTWRAAAAMLLAIAPLGAWLIAMSVLRHHLEHRGHGAWWWHWELREMKGERAHDKVKAR
jgi:Na+/melibiose symporter-like transporter